MIELLPSDWKLLPLAECMEAIIDYRGKTPRKVSAGIPLITAKIVKGGRILDVQEYIVPEDYDDWMQRGLPEPGDVVITTEAPLGEVAQLDNRKVALAQRLITLRGKPDLLDNIFLKFLMQSESVQEQLQARGTGTTVIGIRQRELRQVHLPLPPLSEQRAIARILGALDDKIELNRRMNHTLEEMARAIFKSWFVDFDPVAAKSEGRQPYGMNTETAALFPYAFQDSELGPIPKGWQVKSLGSELDIVKGRSYSSSELQESDIALVSLKSIERGGGYRPDGLKPFTGKYKPGQVLHPGELVVACTDITQNAEVVGRPAIVPHDSRFRVLVASLDLLILRPHDPDLSVPFLYTLMRAEDYANHIVGYASGTTVLHLSNDGVPSYLFTKPPSEILKVFNRIAQPIYEHIESNRQSAATLAAVRDALLPKLLSGEIRVKQAEKLLEHVP